MDRQNVIEWLWFTACLGCGSNRIWEVTKRFDSVTEAYLKLHDPQVQKEHLTPAEIKTAAKYSDKQSEELISYCESKNIYIMTYDDGHYPEQLRSIYNPPAVMFCRGDLSCLENNLSLSVVGTRRPSDYSVKLTSALVRELAEYGFEIISGFAVGIDITANLSAVRNGGQTIAVLGCGLDHDYPKENVKYRSEIEAHGLFISEYYPKAGGTRYSFPTRNRILSGLSLATIVIEAAEKSGALITANLALEQGKDVFAVAPHNLFDVRYGGNVSMIRDGATCLCGVRDILYAYYENYGHKIASAAKVKAITLPKENSISYTKTQNRTSENKDKNNPNSTKNSGRNLKTNAASKTEIDISIFTDDEAKVYNTLKNAEKPMLADELAEICGMDISDMLMILTELEIDGAVISAAGQSYTVS